MLGVDAAPGDQISRGVLHELVRGNPQRNRSRLIPESTHRTITDLRTHNIYSSRHTRSENSQPGQNQPIRKRSNKPLTLQRPHNRPRHHGLRQRYERRQHRADKNQNQRPRLQPQNPHKTTKTTLRRISEECCDRPTTLRAAAQLPAGSWVPRFLDQWHSRFWQSLGNFRHSTPGNHATTERVRTKQVQPLRKICSHSCSPAFTHCPTLKPVGRSSEYYSPKNMDGWRQTVLAATHHRTQMRLAISTSRGCG